MDALGQYSPSGKRKKASSRDVKQLRANMQKVPLIQEKSDEFHQQQSHQADALLKKTLEEKHTQSSPRPNATKYAENQTDISQTILPRSTLMKSLRTRIVDKFG